MLSKVISGGQTGADEAGLFAAEKVGIKTGGWMPFGLKRETSDITGEALAKRFGLLEHASRQYSARTRKNAHFSDGTVIISADMKSPGTICTIGACDLYEKPWIDIFPFNDEMNNLLQRERFINWILNENIGVLNVAGNRESKFPGIRNWAYTFLVDVFERVQKEH